LEDLYSSYLGKKIWQKKLSKKNLRNGFYQTS
jgi:hypothetical protein